MRVNKKVISLIIGLIVVVAVAAGAYYIGLGQGKKVGYDAGVKASEEAYNALIEKTTTAPALVNPAENIPTANPFEGVKTNPFEGVYTNPFK